MLAGPVVIEVRGVEKTFRIPDQRVDTVKERVAHPLRRVRYRELRALRGISFDVHRGEFFGIVGRNGSGKSTLLKILASIYRADAGTIRMAGRLAPFIELGVGFNPELTARENVELNGVMMGLGRREAARRLDRVLEFAELEEFVDLKLKNYSSGMMVRLAFAVMVEADADVMLVDEVLAVGDAAFAQKCTDVFREKRDAGKTLVLVTHDMATVQAFCDRAMLIHDGEQRYLGDPEEADAALLPAQLRRQARSDRRDRETDVAARSTRGSRTERRGRVADVAAGQRFRFNLLVRGRARRCRAPSFGFELLNVDDVSVLGFGIALEDADGEPQAIAAGQRVKLSRRARRPSSCPGATRSSARSRAAAIKATWRCTTLRLLDFLVNGTDPMPGMVDVRADVARRSSAVGRDRRAPPTAPADRSSCATSADRRRSAAAGGASGS